MMFRLDIQGRQSDWAVAFVARMLRGHACVEESIKNILLRSILNI
jgi:hypothetical protein